MTTDSVTLKKAVNKKGCENPIQNAAYKQAIRYQNAIKLIYGEELAENTLFDAKEAVEFVIESLEKELEYKP